MIADAPQVRVARCRCGQLTATCRGEPVRVSVCHCRNCRRRSGSAFAAQARFAAGDVTIAGESRVWEQAGGSGRRAFFRWCPTCAGTVAFTNEGMEETVAIPLGAFDDDDLPTPLVEVWEERRLPWVEIVGEGIARER